MIPEAPFFFAITALSGSLAGLAGLVAGLRRSDGFRAVDRYRLRQIVEFSFANALLALALFPAIALTDDSVLTVRILCVVALVYGSLNAYVLLRRMRREAIPATTWFRVVTVLSLATLGAVFAGIATGDLVIYEVVMLLLLARPMLAFLLVLSGFDVQSPEA
jgi:hypothetical protein